MRRIAAALIAALAFPAAAILQSETFATARGSSHAAVDAASGRVFVSNAASISIVDLAGRNTTIATSEAPGQVAVSAVHRRAVVVHPAGSHATVIDADTLQARSVMTGLNPHRVVIVERTGFAYVIGKGLPGTGGSGSITEIDLRSGFARTFPVPGFWPEAAAVDAAGTRLYLIGASPIAGAAFHAGFVQVFDTQTRTIPGAPVQLGRLPRHVMVSPAGDAVYVVGHVDHVRQELAAGDARRASVRPALFVLEPYTFAVRRTFALPDTRDLDLRGPLFQGRAELLGDMVYVLDTPNEHLTLVDLAHARVETVDLEAPGQGLAVNAAAKTVVVSMNGAGTAAIFSLAGQRLDTAPIGRAPGAGEAAPRYDIATDAGSGTAWVTNGHAGTASALRQTERGGTPQLVSFTDLWSSPGNPGWGVFIDQQGATLFATLFTYDTAGKPTWYFMSNGKRQPDGAFAGELYHSRGATPDAPRKVTGAGTMRFEPAGDGSATLTYYIDGMLHRRALERFRFSPATRECRWAVGPQSTPLARANFTSLWSNPADPGWGLAVSHQGESTFAVLFAYDADARPTWAVMSNGRRDEPGHFAGDMYRASEAKVERAGQMSLAFATAEAGVLRYRLGGLDFRAPILRQAFSKLTTHCAS